MEYVKMEYTKTKTISIGDIVECLTRDGWESGEVINLTPDVITVLMDGIGDELDFGIDRIR